MKKIACDPNFDLGSVTKICFLIIYILNTFPVFYTKLPPPSIQRRLEKYYKCTLHSLLVLVMFAAQSIVLQVLFKSDFGNIVK